MKDVCIVCTIGLCSEAVADSTQHRLECNVRFPFLFSYDSVC